MIPLCQRDDDTKPTTTKGFLKSIGRGLGEIGQLQNFLSLGWNVAWLKWFVQITHHYLTSGNGTGSKERYSVNHKQIPNASELELFEGSRVYLEHHNNPSKGCKTPYFTFQVSLKLNKKRKDYLLILLCIMVKECYLIAFRLSSELKQIVLKRLKFTLF